MLTVETASSTHDLTVLATVKAELGITDTAQDTQLGVYIRQASEMICGWCGVTTFARETVEETWRAVCDAPHLILARDIAVEIASVVVDGTTLDADEYELDGGLLFRLSDDERISWTGRKIVATYDAGYELLGTLPHAIERACLDLAVGLHRGAGRDQSIRSEQTEGVGETQYFDGRRKDVPPLAPDRLAALDRHRRWVVG